MQHSLFHLFSLYGDILEINVKRNLKMKGQAFIVFSNVENATKALHDMQGYNFFDKRMVG
jgi:RNA recognition motif-containing protein